MDPNALFTVALGLTPPWEVRDLRFSVEEKRLDIVVDFERGADFQCPVCGAPSKAHDTEERTWRHLDFFQHAAYLTARVPRCQCDEHGVKSVAVPWARAGSGFTLMFEALLMVFVREMPVVATGRLVGEHGNRIWRVLNHYVHEARAKVDMSGVTRLGVDETAARRGHDYDRRKSPWDITLVTDMDQRQLLFATEGRGQDTLGAFKEDLEAHKGDASQIKEACIDMSNAFIKGLGENFPEAHITFDRFHVMKLMGDALDAVRREEVKSRPELKRSRYWWLKNPENLKADQRERLQALKAQNLDTARAYQMKLTLQDFYEQSNPRAAATFLGDWCEMVLESGLESVKKVARTLLEHAAGVLRWFRGYLTNGFAEGLNSILQTAKAKARGYSTTRNLITIAYLLAGKLDYGLPT